MEQTADSSLSGQIADSGVDHSAPRDDIETRVYAEQVALLYSMAPFTLRMAVLFSTMVAIAVAWVVPLDKLALWYVANNGVSAFRYLLVRGYRSAQPPPEAARRWAPPFIALAAAAGAIWGLMGTWLFPQDDPTHQAMMLAFVIGTAAVGLSNLSSLMAAYAAFCLPMLLPVAANLFVIGGHANEVLGVALLLFTFIAVSNARRHQDNTVELLRLRFANAEIAEERERALQAARQASEVKSRFLANMSHEIRTPLNGILGMTLLLAESKLDEEQRFRLDVVRRSGSHLLALLNDILDFSKVEAGKLVIERAPFDLRGAVSEVADLLAAVAHDKGISFAARVDADVARWVEGDASRVKQVLHNLIGNAIKFTDRGNVRLSVHRADKALLRFEVTDTGVGIRAQDLDGIFAAFQQADGSHARRHGGSGLGLAISRELARAMGGDVECSSEPGRGSTFRFSAELPETQAPQTVVDGAVLGPLPPERFFGRVLMAEDNAVNALVAKAHLEKFGLSVDLADNGRQALHRATGADYDLILMDCQMPEMDGFEATRCIRAHEKAVGRKPVVVVALTANVSRGDRERCAEAGMDDYLGKPIDAAELRAVLERHLRRAEGAGSPPARVSPADGRSDILAP